MEEPVRKPSEEMPLVFVGTYTGGASEGIYACRLNATTGELREKQVAGRCENPSYLALDTVRNRLFAVNELTNFAGESGGAVTTFTVDPATGRLTRVNQVPTHGGAPCYVTLERGGRHLLVANYVGGSVTVIPIDHHGALGAATDVATHAGRSVHPTRQTSPHPHSVVLDPAHTHVYVPDLGLDRIVQYRLDRTNGRLVAADESWTEIAAEAGPRHMVFHPSGRFAFVINELNSTVSAFTRDKTSGALTLYQTISTLPDDYTGPNIAADLHLAPGGGFLYASNRGHDSIAAFALDRGTGRLTRTGCTPTLGQTPRGFTLDPSGKFLLVANQDSGNIVVFAVDLEAGTLRPTGHTLEIPSPVCLKIFAPTPSA